MNHDIIAVGGSAGSMEVLLDFVGGLPADLPASLFVTLHAAPGHLGGLPQLLASRGPLQARFPLHGEQVEQGRIYIAPPDSQLYLRRGRMEVVRGPKESGHRPAVDALFRTAANAYGARVIGVVLSGYLECGTAGMMSIKARGGVAVVQEPASARVAEMPRSVIERVSVDYVVQPAELADLLTRLATLPATADSSPSHYVEQLEGNAPGAPAEIVCPLCQGVLTEAPGSFQHFRCHVGHAFSLTSLVAEQGESMERALWAAVRALEESSALSGRLVASSVGELKERFAERAQTQAEHAQRIREMLLSGAASEPSLRDAEPR